MALPWLRILDTVMSVVDIARVRRESASLATVESPDRGRLPTRFEARLAGVLVGALKEVFDRDTIRLELEREQQELERERIERALALEQIRRSGERELGRLRMMTAVAAAGWLGTLAVVMLAGRPFDSVIPRVLIGAGLVTLLGAVAVSFSAQARVMNLLARADTGAGVRSEMFVSADATAVLWLLIAGMTAIALAVLVF